MLVAVATVHLSKGFWVSKGGYEFNLSILAAVAALALTGPGAYSLDEALRIHLPQPATVIAGAIALILGVSATLLSRSPQPAAEAKPQTT
jgi:putative oxidoreductase